VLTDPAVISIVKLTRWNADVTWLVTVELSWSNTAETVEFKTATAMAMIQIRRGIESTKARRTEIAWPNLRFSR